MMNVCGKQIKEFANSNFYVKVKIKLSCNRPWKPIDF
jgi:hypothetical protein